jgi:hypothetical protein
MSPEEEEGPRWNEGLQGTEGDQSLSDAQTTSVTTDVAMLETLDPASREVAVTSMLDQARQWLERAKESTMPAQDVAEFKAFVATVAEAAKQKKLSEEIQLDAIEMVRRSERALGVAIRQGQVAGEVMSKGGDQHRRATAPTDAVAPSPKSFFATRKEYDDTYAMTDNATDEQFELALESAKEEGNLSRRNVVAKVKELSSYRDQRVARWERVARLAANGTPSSQVLAEVGGYSREDSFRKAARDRGITFPADKLSNFRRIDPLYVVEQIVLGLEVTLTTLDLVTYENVTPEQAEQWLERLVSPLRAIRKMQTELKEIK